MGERVGQIAKVPDVKKSSSNTRVRRTKRFQSMDTPVDRILFLQRTAGNQAVSRLMRSGALQAKLVVRQPGDVYEQEADRVADAVMRMPEPGVHRQVEPEEEEEEEETIQAKPLASQTPEVTPGVENSISSIHGGGQPLSANDRSFFEPRFNRDFSQVRVHSNTQAAETAGLLKAQAFTIGNDVVFGSGQYLPETVRGKRLLAHELTHVIQQKGVPRQLQRKSAPLGIRVPEKAPEFKLKGRFPWQNKVLRETIYPHREKELRDFLWTYKEIDLWEELSKSTISPALAKEILGRKTQATGQPGPVAKDIAFQHISREILAGKEHIRNELKRLYAERKTLAKQFTGARRQLRRHRRTRKQVYGRRIIKKLEAGIWRLNREKRTLRREIKNLTSHIAWYEKKRKTTHPHYLKKKRAFVQAQARLAVVKKQLEVLQQQRAQDPEVVKYLKQKARLQAHQERIKTALKTLRQKRLDLRKQSFFMKLLPVHKKRVRTGAAKGRNLLIKTFVAVRWVLHKYKESLKTKAHKELLTLVINQFKAQPARYPPWLQYMVIHFSGMRYKSAHGSWASPIKLLKILKQKELKERIDAMPEKTIIAYADKAKTVMQEQHRDLIKQQAGASRQDRKRIRRQIYQISKKLNKFQGTKRQRRRAVLAYETAAAIKRVEGLTDAQALGILKTLKDKKWMPWWFWRQIVRRTRLRLDVTERDWDQMTKAEKKEYYSRKSENRRWKAILKKWKEKTITSWRKKLYSDSSLIAIRAVCNEVAEHAQQARGVKPKGGLTRKVSWYQQQETRGLKLPSMKIPPFFKRAPKVSDFKPGASIFWLKWRTSSRKKIHNDSIARPLSGIDFTTDDGRVMRRGRRIYEPKGSGWTYHVVDFNGRPAYLRTSRGMCPAQLTLPGTPNALKQWLVWTHEAMVVEVPSKGPKRVITFETGKIGLRVRRLKHLENKTDIFVGYVPARATPPGVMKRLKYKELLAF